MLLVNEFFLGSTVTTLANEPSSPDVSPTIETRSPTTTDFFPNSLAFMAVITFLPSGPSTKHLTRPRSTSIMVAV
ncbi:unannotated protein [freshwater metagenome]|uniref:Unannotated protein n=1 Tax=freshwater metagenome TaxID=449393 RepID=A0A6J6ZS62_9ZZZZ